MRFPLLPLFIVFVSAALPCAVLAGFSDIDGHPYRDAILYMEENNIVEGYPDGTFGPDWNINRAEFTKIVIASQYSDEDINSCLTRVSLSFSDVEPEVWFAKYVCVAFEHGIVNGYPDGTFGPDNQITFAEAAKIIVSTLEGAVGADGAWYKPYVEVLGRKRAIPVSIERVDSQLLRGEMAEILWRMMEEIQNRPTQESDDILHAHCSRSAQKDIAGVDMTRVHEAWLQWYNDARAAEGLHAYSYNSHLHRTAALWSNHMAHTRDLTHKREGQTEYYDYERMTDWFADQGLTFANRAGITHTENIGRGMYGCLKDDCTDDLLEKLQTTFDLYLAEKGKEFKPHYTSVMNRRFKEIGLGIAIDEEDGKYYLAVHYGTEITSNPKPVCE